MDSQLELEEVALPYVVTPWIVDPASGSIYLGSSDGKDGTCFTRYVLDRGRLSAREDHRRLGSEPLLYSLHLLETKPAP